MKKVLRILTCFVLSMMIFSQSMVFVAGASTGITVNPTNAKVLVNGVLTAFEAYTIEGNNYFKLRDLAKVVNGTTKQFEVTYDGDKKAINLLSSTSYTELGKELLPGDGLPKNATLNTSSIYKDGSLIQLTAYNIGGNNFFKLRDLMQKVNIGVTWEGATSTIGIDTTLDYVIPPIVAPVVKTASNLPSVAATLLNNKITLDGKVTSLKIYNISGKEYVSVSNLYDAFKSANKDFIGKLTMEDNSGMHSISYFKMAENMSATNKAYQYNPTLFFSKIADDTFDTQMEYENDITYNFTGYKIDEIIYYPLDEMIKLIDCGLIRDIKTGNINFDTTKKYEPTFAPIPKGEATYMKLQQKLYDAYFQGNKNPVTFEGKVMIPDGATLYVPREVTFDTYGGAKIYVGNNSRYYVRGKWSVEYPDKHLFTKEKDAKNALYINDNSAHPEMVRLDKGKFDWSEMDLPFETANISYVTNETGVDDIFINFTRKSYDIKQDLGIILYEKNGKKYEFIYKNASNRINITNDIVKIAAEKSGVNTAFTKIYIYNYQVNIYGDEIIKKGSDNTIEGILQGNNAILPKPIDIAINWSVENVGSAPVVGSNYKVIYNKGEPKGRIVYEGLPNKLYVAKFGDQWSSKTYTLLKPSAEHAVTSSGMATEYSNIAELNGKKGVDENAYVFKISQFSKKIWHNSTKNYVIQGNLTKENGRTFLNLKLDRAKETKLLYENIIIMADTVATSGSELDVIYKGEFRFAFGDGKMDISGYLDPRKYEEPVLYIFGADLVTPSNMIPTVEGIELNLKTLEMESKEIKINRESAPLEFVKPTETVEIRETQTHLVSKIVTDKDTGLKFDLSTGIITGYTKDIVNLIIPSKIQGVEVSYIGFGAFEDNNMKSVVLPSTLKNIGEQAFAGCVYMELIKMPEGLKTIGAASFVGCPSLTSIDIPDSVTEIGTYAFQGNNFKTVKLPKSLINISNYLFMYSDNLTSIVIPEGVLSIGEGAFNYSNKLASISIPSTVKLIGKNAFESTNWLEKQPKPVMVNGIDAILGGDSTSVKKATPIVVETKIVESRIIVESDKFRLEAENGVLAGGVEIVKNSKASNQKNLAYMQYAKDSVEFKKVSKAYGFTIGYAKGGWDSGKVFLYINDVFSQSIILPNTDGWENFEKVDVLVDIPMDANIKFVTKKIDFAVNMDYIDIFKEK